MIEGKYPVKPSLPAVAGFEGVACVRAVGAAVGASFAPGDWVIPVAPGVGTWRQHGCFAASGWHKVANDIPVDAAATLFVKYAGGLMVDVQVQTRTPHGHHPHIMDMPHLTASQSPKCTTYAGRVCRPATWGCRGTECRQQCSGAICCADGTQSQGCTYCQRCACTVGGDGGGWLKSGDACIGGGCSKACINMVCAVLSLLSV